MGECVIIIICTFDRKKEVPGISSCARAFCSRWGIFADIAMALASQKARGHRWVFLSFSALSYGSLPLKRSWGHKSHHIVIHDNICMGLLDFFLFFLSVPFFLFGPTLAARWFRLASFRCLSAGGPEGEQWGWSVAGNWTEKPHFSARTIVYLPPRNKPFVQVRPYSMSGSWKILGRCHYSSLLCLSVGICRYSD